MILIFQNCLQPSVILGVVTLPAVVLSRSALPDKLCRKFAGIGLGCLGNGGVSTLLPYGQFLLVRMPLHGRSSAKGKGQDIRRVIFKSGATPIVSELAGIGSKNGQNVGRVLHPFAVFGQVEPPSPALWF